MKLPYIEKGKDGSIEFYGRMGNRITSSNFRFADIALEEAWGAGELTDGSYVRFSMILDSCRFKEYSQIEDVLIEQGKEFYKSRRLIRDLKS